MSEFLMPSLGSDMEAGTLIKWRRAVGDRVKRGDVIAEVETDKGIIEVEVFSAGLLDKLLVPTGSKVPVGTALAVIRDEATPPPAPTPAPAPALATAPALAPAPTARASPYARRRAQELGLELSEIPSTKPGIVTVEDIERAVALRMPRQPPAEPVAPDKRMRRAIAATMARAKREIPHFYLSHTIDLTPARAWLEAENAKRSLDDRIVEGALLIRAVARAARKVPELNGRWMGEECTLATEVNVGIAISLRNGGLVAPALHEADRLSLDALMQALKDVTARARAGSLRSSEMSDATITLTSLGERGVDTVQPIIFPPQIAMVGAGTPRMRPWAVEGGVVARPLVDLTLAVDHRAVDGHRAGRFLLAMAEDLAHPEAP
ncbi:MAG: dihydrolipoamide acetyltransferase family protein [Polyangiales bacterium]